MTPESLVGESSAITSPRQREILQLTIDGLTNREIAAKLGVSVKTIEAHSHNLVMRLTDSSNGFEKSRRKLVTEYIIREVSNGNIFIGEIPDRVVLTKRQGMVAACLMHGETNDEISKALYVTRAKVEFDLLNIYRGLGIEARPRHYFHLRAVAILAACIANKRIAVSK